MYVPSESESELCVWQNFLPGRGGTVQTDQHNMHHSRGGEVAGAWIFIKICINRTFLFVFQPFLQRSFILILLMSKPLTIWILSVCSYSYWAPSLPKLRFVQERLSDFQEQCAQLCQYCTIHWKELVTPAPPPHASLNPFMATSLPPFWHSLTPFKRVSDALWGGGCCGNSIQWHVQFLLWASKIGGVM